MMLGSTQFGRTAASFFGSKELKRVMERIELFFECKGISDRRGEHHACIGGGSTQNLNHRDRVVFWGDSSHNAVRRRRGVIFFVFF